MDELTYTESQLCVKCFARLFHTHLSHVTTPSTKHQDTSIFQGPEKVNNMNKALMVYHCKIQHMHN